MIAPGSGTLRTMAANHARLQSTRDKLDRVEATLRTMRRERTTITYPAAARRATVSRTFLYQNLDAKTLVTTAIAASGDQRRWTQATADAHIEASWHQRALNAEYALKDAHSEIDAQRERIGSLLGQLRDLQAEYTEEPPNTSPQRTPKSNSASASSPRRIESFSRGSKPPAPTIASSTNDSPISKLNWLIPNTATLDAPCLVREDGKRRISDA